MGPRMYAELLASQTPQTQGFVAEHNWTARGKPAGPLQDAFNSSHTVFRQRIRQYELVMHTVDYPWRTSMQLPSPSMLPTTDQDSSLSAHSAIAGNVAARQALEHSPFWE
jgi:hypothetical protein